MASPCIPVARLSLLFLSLVLLVASVSASSCSYREANTLTAEARLAQRKRDLHSSATKDGEGEEEDEEVGGGGRLFSPSARSRERRMGPDPAPEREYRSFDGLFNNIGAPTLGGHDFQLLRHIPPAYADNVQRLSNPNGPNPLEVSRQVMAGPSGTQSVMNRTVTLVHFGQHIAEELINAMPTHCPSE